MTFLKLQIAATLSTAILIKRVASKFTNVPLLIKILHFTYVWIFALIGVVGFQLLSRICWHRQEYAVAFSFPNPLGLSVSTMEWIGYVFAPAGAILCVAALRLGDLRNWARRVVAWIAMPYSLLYMDVTSTVTNEIQSPKSFHVAYVATVILFMISTSATIFYSSKKILEYLKFE